MTSVELVQSVSGFGNTILARVGPANLAAGVVLLAALLADLLLARRIGAGWRGWLFVAVLVRAVLPLHIGYSGLQVLSYGAAKQAAYVTIGAPVGAMTAKAVGPVLDAGFWAGIVYGIVAVLLFARWIWGRAMLAREMRTGRQATPRLVAAAGTTPILQHTSLGPLVAGILRPVVVLPDSVVDASDDESLACILAHEQAHISRGDHVVQPLWQLVCIAAWPILPVWIAARHLRTLAELACDERAVGTGGAERRRRYADILLALAEGRPPIRADALVPSFGWDLPQRLRALSCRRRWNVVIQGAVVFALTPVLVACTGTGGPGGSDARSAGAPGPVAKDPIVTVTKDGTLYLGKERVAWDAFEERLRKELALRGSKTVLLRAGPLEPAQRIVDLVATMKRSGAMHIAMNGDGSAPNQATVRGSLDKDVIRVVIRRHINEVKYCYETELAKIPTLHGRVSVEFTIAPTGQVVASTLASSTMGNRAVEACLVLAPRRWEFPKPEGGVVIITYPFNFTPAGGRPTDGEI